MRGSIGTGVSPAATKRTLHHSLNSWKGTDTFGLQRAREALFGSRATSKKAEDLSESAKEAAQEAGESAREGLQNSAVWAEHKLGLDVVSASSQPPESVTQGATTETSHGFGGPAGGATLVRPIGVMVSEEKVISGKRYADRPEGLDQFGAEEAEREPMSIDDPSFLDAGLTAVTASRYMDRPEGIDQFGGEEMERTVVELRNGEKRVTKEELARYKDAPEGIDQFGGEGSERLV